MHRVLLISVLAAAAVSLPAAATGKSAATSLVGVVGPGMTITLSDANGGAVTHLDPGDYTVSINDQSILHNYHLFGPGVEQRTDIETTGHDDLEHHGRRRDVRLPLRRASDVDEGQLHGRATSRLRPRRRRS